MRIRPSLMWDMVPKQRSPLVEGFCSERAVSADETVQTVLALGIGNPPPHRVSQRVPDESRCAALCEVVHARGCSAGSQSVCELCDSDDLVQAPKPQHTRGPSFTNTALGDMQGVWCAPTFIPIAELRPAV